MKPLLQQTAQVQSTAIPARADRRLAAAALLGFALTAGVLGSCAGGAGSERPAATRQGVPVALPNRAEFATISAAEERRVAGPELLAQLDSPDAAVRARAAQALGRMPLDVPGDDASQALSLALTDADPGVRAAAAFALGIRRDPTTAGALARAWNDAEARVRQRVVEAASRIGNGELSEQVLSALSDPNVSVRLEAIGATARWDPAAPSAPQVDSALVRIVRHDEPPVTAPLDRIEPLVRVAYGQRRKMIRKSLGGLRTVEQIEAAGVDPQARPETLDLAAWGRLAEA